MHVVFACQDDVNVYSKSPHPHPKAINVGHVTESSSNRNLIAFWVSYLNQADGSVFSEISVLFAMAPPLSRPFENPPLTS